MGDVQTQGKPAGITITDLTSKYKQKVDTYELMINSMSDGQKKIFQTAINLYDIQLRQDRWDSYVGYALKALLMSGHYYNVLTGQWLPCMTESTYVDPSPNPNADHPMSWYNYIESLYPRQACSMLGVSRWDIIDSEVDQNLLTLAMGGEMSYEEYDLAFNLESYELGGEQTKKKPAAVNVIKHPDIPVSSNIDVAELTKGDASTDKFIYAYTDSGESKNKRNWRPMIMDRIAQQVMDQNPPGNMGHVNPKNVGYELPLPVITWIGAITELLPDGTKRLWLKGYIIPTADGVNLKTYIRAKAINSISVYGGLTLLPNAETGVTDVLDIDLKSIDISGKLKEGLNSGITELAGEMHSPEQKQQNNINQESEEQNNMSDLAKITLADLRIANPQLFGEMKTEILNSMKMEDEKKIIVAKAGEMDALSSQVGGNPTEMFKQYQSFAGEMAEAVGLTPQAGAMPTFSDITAKAKEMFSTLGGIVKALNPAQDQNPVEKAEELAKANQLAMNTQAVQNVQAKFNELTAGIPNESIKNLVAMKYQDILQAKPEALPENYAQASIQALEAGVPTTITEVVENANNILKSGQQAGEMAAFDNIGVGAGAGAQAKDPEKMSDEEFAKSLGYNFNN